MIWVDTVGHGVVYGAKEVHVEEDEKEVLEEVRGLSRPRYLVAGPQLERSWQG